jgi:RNA polymerase sigma-70 factor, ECF subfamily
VEPLVPSLNRFARSLARDREEARDLASEAIRIAYEQFGSMRDEQSLTSYLFTVCSRLARRERTRKGRLTPIDVSVENTPSETLSPEMQADMRIVTEAINTLPEAERDTLILHLVAGLKLEEISMIHEVGLSAVKMRLSRGKERLRSKLGIQTHTSFSENKIVKVVIPAMSIISKRM